MLEDADVVTWCDGHGFETKLDSWRNQYSSASPFPHLVIDDFLPNALAEEVVRTFPALSDRVWQTKGSFYTVPGGVARKYELGHKPSFPDAIKETFDKYLFSNKFLHFVSELTGIADLYFDAEFIGGPRSGGLNAVEKGGMLVRHVDFNFSSELNKYRAVNILLYLNKDWSISDGGNLDLWDQQLEGPPVTVTSTFNRCLIFATNSTTYHGYNKVLSDTIRKSINLYFYTIECPLHVDKQPHKTEWNPEES